MKNQDPVVEPSPQLPGQELPVKAVVVIRDDPVHIGVSPEKFFPAGADQDVDPALGKTLPKGAESRCPHKGVANGRGGYDQETLKRWPVRGFQHKVPEGGRPPKQWKIFPLSVAPPL